MIYGGVRSHGVTPKLSKSLDHVSIETHGFGDHQFQETPLFLYHTNLANLTIL